MIPAEFTECYELQLAAYKKNRNPGHAERVADLRTLHRMLVDNHDALVDAVNKDFGCRCAFETKFAETFMAQDAALVAIKHL